MGAIYHQNVKYTGVNMLDDYSIIGPEEKTATASQAYAVGEHFVKDGYFCTAIAAIAQGATLTLNTNYTQGDIAEATDIGNSWEQRSVTSQPAYLGLFNLFVNKKIKLAVLSYNSQTSNANGEFYLPSDIVPTVAVWAPLASANGKCYINVATNSTKGIVTNSETYTVGVLIFNIK